MTARNDNPLTTWLRADNPSASLLRAEGENSMENRPFARPQPFVYRYVTGISPRWFSPLAGSY